MDKTTRPKRTGSQDVQDTSGKKTSTDSRPAGEGSEFFHINEQGEYCFGTECFSMRVKPGSGEIRVIVDRNECNDDAQRIVDALFGEVVKGAPTVYESKSQATKNRQ